ncbi:MAG TPA: hypothetical protein VFA34_06530 [Actinomycetota bacterium]|jgi:hypothetical protein|nr:hypothetical protein [Actinomycetota bacterium]
MRHELHLARVGFLSLIPVGALALVVCGLAAGGRGAASSAIAVGLVAANHLVAALSTGWAPTLRPRVLSIGYAVFVVRMLALLVAFAVVASFTWIHDATFAVSFCVALVAMLAAECVSYARGSYIPQWRVR